MLAQNSNIAKHIKETSFMGFVEVVQNLSSIFKNISYCKTDISQFKPDLIIFIDYPGFNLRIAKWAKEKGYNTNYYIPPKVWAWKENRIEKLRKYIDEIYVIFPFETKFYNRHGIETKYFGNPLQEEITNYRKKHGEASKACIALLPGSRKQEIIRHLKLMVDIAAEFPSEHFKIIMAPNFKASFYHDLVKDMPSNITLDDAGSWSILNQSKAAIVCSGTATLETALFDVPQVVMYKSSAISMTIAKWLVKLKYISLVNLVVDKPLIKELIQEKASLKNLTSELQQLLIVDGSQVYQELHQVLASKQVYHKTARSILERI